MAIEGIAAILAGLALVGQVTNVVLLLRVENAVLRSEDKILQRIAKEYVRDEVCALRHSRAVRGGPTRAVEPA